MRDRSRFFGMLLAAVLAATFAIAPIAATRQSSEAAFADENAAAMATMMKGMHVKPSGNVDRDFATMMISHHQGAIDMALAELRHGSNERLRRIAQGVIVAQRQEIAAMQLVLDQELPASERTPDR